MKTLSALLAIVVISLPAAADLTAAEMGPFKPNGLVVLFTDFGPDSLYAGEMTGTIYRKAPEARVAVLSNAVPPFDTAAAGHLLVNTFTAYPKGTVFACHVGGDPDPALIALRTQTDHVFVAPDNGLLSLVAVTHGAVEVFEVKNDSVRRLSEIPTDLASGRGACGAVAAALATGTPLSEAGRSFPMFKQVLPEPSRVEGGVARGTTLLVDAYGNILTNLRASHLDQLGIEPGKGALVKAGETATGLDRVAVPGDVPPGDRYLWVNHLGLVTLGANGTSLAETLGVTAHAPVTIEAMAEHTGSGDADEAHD